VERPKEEGIIEYDGTEYWVGFEVVYRKHHKTVKGEGEVR